MPSTSFGLQEDQFKCYKDAFSWRFVWSWRNLRVYVGYVEDKIDFIAAQLVELRVQGVDAVRCDEYLTGHIEQEGPLKSTALPKKKIENINRCKIICLRTKVAEW